MAKNTSKDTSSAKSPQSSSMKNAIFIIPLVSLFIVIWLILIWIDQVPSSLTFNWEFGTWLNISMVILLILIVVLVCILPTGERVKTEESTESSKTETVIVKKAKKTSKQKPATIVAVEPEEQPVEFVPMKKEKATPSD